MTTVSRINIFVDFPEYMNFNEFSFDFSGNLAAVHQLPKWLPMLILMIGTALQPCPARNRKNIVTRECANLTTLLPKGAELIATENSKLKRMNKFC